MIRKVLLIFFMFIISYKDAIQKYPIYRQVVVEINESGEIINFPSKKFINSIAISTDKKISGKIFFDGKAYPFFTEKLTVIECHELARNVKVKFN